ncbi:MAG TPA: hypothetical protein VHQ41_02115 [Patescibacteria group bacterium]|jgi:uncharacterized membrane protein YdfJ with MMPL/SSD domain|nr:hypothetical protein [Patescibacteria group bacterium]
MSDENPYQQPKIRVTEYRPQNQQLPASRFPRWLPWLVIAIFILTILVLGGLFWRSQHQLNKLKNGSAQQNQSATQNQDDAKQLVQQVGKLIILPTDEDPTIATVSDLNKLKDQPFFTKAQVGDKVLIYSKAKKAILYRPSSNQIIELAPLNTDGNAGTPTTPAPPATTPPAQ